MLIYVLSDTHGDCDPFFQRYKKLLSPDAIIHLGDYVEDAFVIQKQTGVEVFPVKGNGDWLYGGVPQKRVLTFCDHRILLVHGHNEKVSRGLENLYFKTLEENAELVLFGHTHIPLDIESGGVRLMNPGSSSKPRSIKMERTFLSLEIDSEKIVGKFIYL